MHNDICNVCSHVEKEVVNKLSRLTLALLVYAQMRSEKQHLLSFFTLR